jgi:hypothetical protein
VTETGALRGKLGYMSPEQADGRPVDASSDLYAVGIVLWEMLAGARLFHADSDLEVLALLRRAVVPDPPMRNAPAERELRNIVRRALARDRAARYADAASFERDLEHYLSIAAQIDPAARLAELVREVDPGAPEGDDGWAPTVPEADPDAAPTVVAPSSPPRAGRWGPWAWAAPLVAVAAAVAVLWTAGVIGGDRPADVAADPGPPAGVPGAPTPASPARAPGAPAPASPAREAAPSAIAPPAPTPREPAATTPHEPPAAAAPATADPLRPATPATRRPRRPREDPAAPDRPVPTSRETLVDPFSLR